MTRKIVQLILEARGNQGLSIFDIDETLFYSKAKVKVVKDGKVIKSLDNVQFNNYKLGNGEDFDFGEFKSAKIFNQTSTPIGRMIAKAKAIIRNAVAKAVRESNNSLIQKSPLTEKLRRRNLLISDPRKKERKKYGLRKARRAPQFSKR